MHYKIISGNQENGSFIREGTEQSIAAGSRLYDNIIPMMINRGKNQKILRNIPWRPFLDLAVVYRFIGFLPGISGCGVLIDLTMMKALNMTEEKLYQSAVKNMNILTPLYYAKLTNEMKKFMPQETDRDKNGKFPELPLYLLTNSIHRFGAASLLCEEKISEVAGFLKKDLYILPSSFHEILLLPSDFISVNRVYQVVKEVNESVVDKEDWLSDQVYLYSRDKRKTGILLPSFC